MKEYYLDRLHWIFRYCNGNFWYCLAKTLSLLVGVPLYAVSFVVEMIFTFINMLFAWIPVLNVVVMVVCKAVIALFAWTIYICILPDIGAYRSAKSAEVVYDISDADDVSVADQPADADDVSATEQPADAEIAAVEDENNR